MDTCQDATELASLRNLALGAEALNPATLVKAQHMAPNATIFNCYGRAHLMFPDCCWSFSLML